MRSHWTNPDARDALRRGAGASSRGTCASALVVHEEVINDRANDTSVPRRRLGCGRLRRRRTALSRQGTERIDLRPAMGFVAGLLIRRRGIGTGGRGRVGHHAVRRHRQRNRQWVHLCRLNVMENRRGITRAGRRHRLEANATPQAFRPVRQHGLAVIPATFVDLGGYRTDDTGGNECERHCRQDTALSVMPSPQRFHR